MNLNLLQGFLPAGLNLEIQFDLSAEFWKGKILICVSYSGFVICLEKIAMRLLGMVFYSSYPNFVSKLEHFTANTWAFLQNKNIMAWCTKDDDVKTEHWNWGIKEMKMQSSYVGQNSSLLKMNSSKIVRTANRNSRKEVPFICLMKHVDSSKGC